MGLELNVTKEFVELTDAMVAAAEEKEISNENLNFTLVKVPMTNSSAIETAADFQKRENYKSGVGRVILVPRLAHPDTDACPNVGDYVVYSHEAKYTINEPVVNWLFGMKMAFEEGREPIVNVRDVDIMHIIPAANVHRSFKLEQ